ncbi:extracellular catalytic domain type 1 short-chain-length polyhydroxyalkanoate depolymerase [Peterkaempfera bronchialis]|uniref:Esterase n=1 Tax=Peterkaempfera bronchialis TaxID=2126346 RepID=A0A345SYX6_9ACTN|nr:PHB depolymerase family esterase [Peterkaempfera bronchialis]AXI78931.1 esterase [Peterkaempfera bronchialis]
MRTAHRRSIRSAAVAVLGVVAVVAAVLGLGPGGATAAHAASLVQVTGFGSNPGNLQMYRYVPDGLPSGRPLVLALHGCAQSAAAYDDETGWTKWADQWGFSLVLPQQQSSNNSTSCFNWFQAGDFSRDQGEALSIRQMVDRMKADYGTDAGRVYVTGLSAGGAMTAALLADYPDVFAGGGVVAGLPYRCASSVNEASVDCMTLGKNQTPKQWGDLVRSAYPSWTGARPKVSLWQGDADYTVKTTNLGELMKQWTDANGVDQTADISDTVAGYPHRVYTDASGSPRVETYTITGMGHGQPVDPGSGATQCGTAGAYILNVHICASYWIGHFWGLDGSTGTPTPTPTPTPTATPTLTPTPTPTATPTDGSTTTLTLANDDARDGYVKATADGGSASVGPLESTMGLAVGRGADGQYNRTLLSFDTSRIPAGATVTGARLTVAYGSSVGNPWTSPAGNRLLVDVRSGCFGTTCSTEAADWAAAPTAAGVAEVGAFSSGTQTSSAFSAAGLAAIDRTGTTQLRLAFERPQTALAYVFLQHGAKATLTVEYR